MKSSSRGLTIGEVAERAGVGAHVLRHWESVGLLSPARVEGRRRRYGPDDLHRVAVILRSKEAGLSLDEIRQIVAGRDLRTRRRVLHERRTALVERIAAAQTALAMVECALSCDHENVTECAHVQALVTPCTDGLLIDAGAC